MKKFILFLSVIIMCLALTACGSSNSDSTSEDTSTSNSKDDWEITADDFKSDQATGNTIGSSFTYKDVTVTLDSAEIIPTREHAEPDPGNEYVRLNWTITNNSDENFKEWDFVVATGYADNQPVDSTVAVMDDYLTTDLLAGQSATDQTGFEVPVGFKKLVFEVDMDSTPDQEDFDASRTKFSITADQCTQGQ